ncbi:serine hydrolase domain-containing protein [Kineococcus gynurae]|uniref:Serine hydrolase domain-containing protein n=1 Tax=Kineococcus gynurae TaxID=452979 RepID=A0ABV5LUJ0_9ACTN
MTTADLLPGTVRALDLALARAQATSRLPSVSAGLVRGGRLVWSGTRGTTGIDAPTNGLPGPSTQYRIGSITKTFVAVGVLKAVEDGLVGLEDRIGAHLPEIDALPAGGIGHLTVGQLLGQASGIQAETDGPWWERTPGGDFAALLPLLGPGALRHRPGTRFHYSNVGFAVLGELLGRLRGAAWHEVVRTELLQPLGMTRTTLRPDGEHARGLAVHPWADVVLPEPEHDAGAMAPAGQLWSTVEDLARWSTVVAGTSGLLSPATVAEMRRPQSVDDARNAAWSVGYGLGWQLWNVDGRRHAGHSGSMPGFVAMLRVDVESGDGVLALTNTTTGFGDLPATLLRTLAETEPPLPAPWTPRPVADDVLELVGPWYWGPAALTVRSRADGGFDLGGLAGRGRASRFVRATDGDGWVGLDEYYAGERLRPVRGADGTVSHLDLASFRLTRSPYDPDADVPGGVDGAGWGSGA